jgi:hypothetical protein
MAPRGIVAAATASAFGLSLTQAGVSGADQILPIAFVVIFGTVVLYGLIATPVARLLGLAGAGVPVILVIAGHPWARTIAQALKAAGLRVRLWTGSRDEQAAAREAGLDAGKVPLGADVESREAELEEVGDALLLTESDDFNALAAFELRQELGAGRVYRLAPAEGEFEPTPTYVEGAHLFAKNLTFSELTRRFDAGARLVELPVEGDSDHKPVADGLTPLFVVAGDGSLRVVTAGSKLETSPGDRAICLAEGAGSP